MQEHAIEMGAEVDPRDFRAAVGEFATGVTVVTATDGAAPAGMTVNSFTSVSLEPLLILVSMTHGSRTLATVARGGNFAVNILHRWQREVALHFARPQEEFPRRFVEASDGFLVVPGALAYLGCEVVERVAAGDHDLVIGRVVQLHHQPGEPLVFHRGRLGGLAIDAFLSADALGGWDAV